MGCLQGLLAGVLVLGVGLFISNTNGVRSVTTQSIHYLSRPSFGIRHQPVSGAAAWRGDELMGKPELYTDILTQQHLEDIEGTLAHATAVLESLSTTARPSAGGEEGLAGVAGTNRDMGWLKAADCPLSELWTNDTKRWLRNISSDPSDGGLGFHLIRGVPVDRWGLEKTELFWWCLGLHLGVPGAQNNDGDLLGHVRDLGADPNTERQFKTNAEIDFHTDFADVVGLLAVTTSASGGVSRLISTVTAYNIMLEEAPQLVPSMYQPVWLDARGSGGVDYLPITPVAHFGGRVATVWHEEYFHSLDRFDSPPPPLSAESQEMQRVYGEILDRSHLWFNMTLEPGDIQLVSNHVLLHGRTAFDDVRDASGEVVPHSQRHLLRLWISTESPTGAKEWLFKQWARIGVLCELISTKVRIALKR